MTVLDTSDQWPRVDEIPFDPDVPAVNAQVVPVAFISAGTAANTRQSYLIPLAYWSAWLAIS
ncbi:hypothetical protein CUN61_20270 [Pseudomonas arsenicoxydans]|uniref:Uncharacterized protein n=1 Tax=Pseudomonas arsenicoxydans TaxID=702115 RepID=A0A4P6G3W8_9PSED|nr:hypothetical protein CUN61_20270 [Pseudomonas arsenicoxydans]